MISKEEREQDKDICEAATPGEWCSVGYQHEDDAGPHVEDEEERTIAICQTDVAEHRANGAFIAHARTALPRYIAAAEEMERRIAAAEAHIASGAWSGPESIAFAEVFRILRGEP